MSPHMYLNDSKITTTITTDSLECSWGCEIQLECMHIADRNKNGINTLENSFVVSYKVKHELTGNPAVKFVGTYPKKWKLYLHTNICIQVFRVFLFIIIKNWKQPKSPSSKIMEK